MMTLENILQIVRGPGRKPLAYIAVGLLNTVIGYVIGVVCLFLLCWTGCRHRWSA